MEKRQWYLLNLFSMLTITICYNEFKLCAQFWNDYIRMEPATNYDNRRGHPAICLMSPDTRDLFLSLVNKCETEDGFVFHVRVAKDDEAFVE